MDQRSAAARALHDRLQSVGDQLGGLEHMTPIERSLAERWIHIEALAQRFEESARAGREFELPAYLATVDRLHSLSRTLGTARRARPARSLAEYIAASAAARPQAVDAPGVVAQVLDAHKSPETTSGAVVEGAP